MARQSQWIRRRSAALAEFLQTEATGGYVLLVAAALAVIWANVLGGYEDFWHRQLTIGPLSYDLRHWVNDGLMTVFFFVVGLEIKRELVTGDLRDPRIAALPIAAAAGGMIVPAAVYLVFNGGREAGAGWGIPMATDIAFVLGVLALLGRRAPSGLRLFLLTLAIVDDLGAIVVIAIFYTPDTQILWLFAAAGGVAVIVALRMLRVASPLVYVIPGIAVWFATAESGIHPTIAGAALGLLTPAKPFRDRDVLVEIEDRLHPLSSYVVVPIFALANAGLRVTAGSLREAASSRVFLGVAIGLLAGKIAGITGASWLSWRFKLGRLPDGVGTSELLGGAALAGIGFTVSLFIVGLGLEDEHVAFAKMGVVAGSVASALVGTAVLVLAFRARQRREAANRRRT